MLSTLLVLTLVAAAPQPPPRWHRATEAAFAATTGRTAQELVPKGWALVGDGEAKGDLNGDGLVDLALVVEALPPRDAGDAEAPPRALALYFASKDGTFKLAGLGPRAILSATDGGVMGDPWQGVTIDKRKVVTVSFYGGSGERWAMTFKYRHQDGAFHLIGSTHTSFSAIDPEGSEVVIDTNYLTGRYDVGSKRKSIKARKGVKIPKAPLHKLADFDAASGEAEPHVFDVYK